jgi:hypothetical protein
MFDPENPISYLRNAEIHRQIRIEEISLDPPAPQAA